MSSFIEYIATNGTPYALHPQQIRGFQGVDGKETKVLATLGGTPLIFRVARPYKEVYAEWKKEMERHTEEAA